MLQWGRAAIFVGYALALLWLQWRIWRGRLAPSKRPKYWLGSLIAAYAAALYATILIAQPRVTEAWIIASQVTHWLVLSHVVVVAATSRDHE